MNAHFNTTILLINELIPEGVFQPSDVSKRAILPFIGEIGKHLFGLATTGDVATLASHINMLTRQNNKMLGALAQHGGDFSSYISQVDHRFNNMLAAIGQNSKTLLLLEQALLDTEENIRYQYQKSEEVIATQMLESQQIRHELEKLQIATAEFAAGKLPAILIPPHVLAESIN
ncbi:hypothetical protein CHS0354_036876 [Potamilus streckersoni]|uniref:Uncharacterized protein n=1 Tax=Potamilus streckersoni TaxID=2493646 RepID=A0AAE0T1L6_9BIVA|nr:hypothetical protein CHS0354_036876 [Potamilus streckersoni]